MALRPLILEVLILNAPSPFPLIQSTPPALLPHGLVESEDLKRVAIAVRLVFLTLRIIVVVGVSIFLDQLNE